MVRPDNHVAALEYTPVGFSSRLAPAARSCHGHIREERLCSVYRFLALDHQHGCVPFLCNPLRTVQRPWCGVRLPFAAGLLQECLGAVRLVSPKHHEALGSVRVFVMEGCEPVLIDWFSRARWQHRRPGRFPPDSQGPLDFLGCAFVEALNRDSILGVPYRERVIAGSIVSRTAKPPAPG